MKNTIPDRVEQFFSNFPIRRYDKGQILIFAGDETQYIHFIVKGRVEQYDISSRGEVVVVNDYKTGAYFPLSGSLNDTPNKYFFGAATNVEVRIAPPDKVVDFLRSDNDVLLDLLKRVNKGGEGLMEKLVRLMSDTARNRLLFELYVECRRFGDKQSDGSCVLKIQETHLAARTGLARETISREIHKMKEEGLLSLKQHRIIVNDIKRLEKSLAA